MSVTVMALAWYVGDITPAQKAVLLALADHADEDGNRVYPAVERLCLKTSYAERTVRRALSDLREMRLIHIVNEATRYKPTEYRIDLPAMQARQNRPPARVPEMHPSASAGVPENTAGVPENTVRGATAAPKPSVEPSVEPPMEPSESASAGADGPPPPAAQPDGDFDAVYGKGTVSFDPPPTTTPSKQSIQESWNKPLSEMPPHQAMFAAVLDAIGWDRATLTERDRGQVAQTCRVLREAGYEYADVGEFMTRVWFREWQWEKNQSRPSLNQLRRDIGKVRAGIPVELPRRNDSKVARTMAAFDEFEAMIAERGIS